ncbi:hypothetical protein H4S04_001639 [Coemansia sp. S16]|nr:hypothetical protein H4S03_000618 [Coemansia sp. S3946]KAJ2051987.1 hypothetical protein H4S04_001639 [Coemansia sp. S16]KAJ2068142.1 hypothetical protein GGH13_005024 [Coemansia sp. S155-1]KAJ2347953.1 hypothetical protein GGH92_003000 [Coemansia sp. RSA 2673]
MLTAKRYVFKDSELFKDTIVNQFKPEGVADSTSDKGDKIGASGAGGKPDENELLKRLAISLHECLFKNPRLNPDFHGTVEKQKCGEQTLPNPSVQERLEAVRLYGQVPPTSEITPMVNPFKERAEKWKDISEELLAFTNVYWEQAMAFQKDALKAKSNAATGTIPQ